MMKAVFDSIDQSIDLPAILVSIENDGRMAYRLCIGFLATPPNKINTHSTHHAHTLIYIHIHISHTHITYTYTYTYTYHIHIHIHIHIHTYTHTHIYTQNMASLQRKTAKTHKGRRVLDARAPKLVENTKTALFLTGTKTSQVLKLALRDLALLKKPDVTRLTRRNPIRPFEDATSLEFLCKTNDTPLFAFGSHTKKRPHNLIMGRMFDFQLLDMVEFGIDPDTFKDVTQLASERKTSSQLGSKPCFVFIGDHFETNEDLKVVKSVIVDFFRGDVVDIVNLAVLDHVYVVTAASDTKIHFRHYAVALKRSGTRIPNVSLDEIGPTLDLTFRRRVQGDSTLRRESLRIPKAAKPVIAKNVERGELGDKTGRIHMQRQDFGRLELHTKKFKRQSKSKSAGSAAEAAAAATAADE
jgi:ribosome production factor 2